MIASQVYFLSVTVIDSRITLHISLFHVLSNGVAYNYVGVIFIALLEIAVRLKTLVRDVLRYCKVKHSVWKDKEASSMVLSGRFLHVRCSPLTEINRHQKL